MKTTLFILLIAAVVSTAIAHYYGYWSGKQVEYWPESRVLLDQDGNEVKEIKESVEYRSVSKKIVRLEAEVRFRLLNSPVYIGAYKEWHENGLIRIEGRFSSGGNKTEWQIYDYNGHEASR